MTHNSENNILDSAGNVIKVNYMYSLEPSNPVLALAYTGPYWYMFFFVPVIVVYLGAIYSKQIVTWIQSKRKKGDQQ